MMRLIYSPRSLDDFDRILKRIDEDNSTAAVQLGEDLMRSCELLEENPLLGEKQSDLTPAMRRFICRGYGIYYEVNDENKTIVVARFLPPRMNVTPELFQ